MRLGLFAQTVALALCLLPLRLQAQLYPMPGAISDGAVICTGCAGTNSAGALNDGLPTYPYAPPLMNFVGRYVDSQTTANYQHIGFRTARARLIRAYPGANGLAPPRIYIQIGNAVGAYALDTFFSQKLPAGPVSVGGVKTGTKVQGAGRNPLERITMWDGFMYPEATDSGWTVPLIDQQDPMAQVGPFDVDDRGYLYGSWPSFGWGIALDDGRTNGVHFAKVVQMSSGNISPQAIIALRLGAKYYALKASSSTDHVIFDVTNPAAPQQVRVSTGADKAMLQYDRSDTVRRVAYIDARRALQVYTYADLIAGAAAVMTATTSERGGFTAVAFDETGNIWAITASKVVKYTVAGAGYVPTEYTPFPNLSTMSALTVAGGHLAVIGVDRGAVHDVRVARIEPGGPRELDLGGFFRNYYHGALPSYAQPGPYTYPFDVKLVPWSGKTYLMYSASGLGDVYELQPEAAPPACEPPASAVVSIAGSSSTCAAGTGGTASVAVTGAGAVTYQWGWRPVGGGSIQTITGATASTYQLSAADLGPAGQKELVVTVTSSCGLPLISNAVAVVVQPAAIAISASDGVFASSTQNMASVPDLGAGSYSWSITNGTIESGQGTPAIRYTAGASGAVELRIDATAGSCSWIAATSIPTVVRSAGASMFYLITPCRIADTRDSTAIASGSTRTLSATGVCGIPADAKSIAANVTVVSPPGDGFLAIHAADAAWAGTSTLNYRVGRSRANSAIVPLSASGQLILRNEGTSSHFIVDVTGYFR